MKLIEWGNDKGHYDIGFIKQDYPDLYGFMESQIGQMSLVHKAIIDVTQNTSGILITFVLRPQTSADFITKRLEGVGVAFDKSMMASGEMITFETDWAKGRVHLDGRTETWQFQINEEYMAGQFNSGDYDEYGEKKPPMDNYAKQRGRR